jgi:hypothetical protein
LPVVHALAADFSCAAAPRRRFPRDARRARPGQALALTGSGFAPFVERFDRLVLEQFERALLRPGSGGAGRLQDDPERAERPAIRRDTS